MITLSPGNPMRVVLMTILIFEVIVFSLAIPVMIFISDVPGAAAGGFADSCSRVHNGGTETEVLSSR